MNLVKLALSYPGVNELNGMTSGDLRCKQDFA